MPETGQFLLLGFLQLWQQLQLSVPIKKLAVVLKYLSDKGHSFQLLSASLFKRPFASARNGTSKRSVSQCNTENVTERSR